MDWQKIYELADIMKSKRKLLDAYTTLHAMEIRMKKEMTGWEISQANTEYRKEYPDKSDD